MNAAELKVLRLDAGKTQAGAAEAMGITPSAYTSYERGAKQIPDDVAYIATKRLGRQDDGAAVDEVALALGEAVLLLDAEGREELFRNVRREVVVSAVADVAMARVRGSLAEAIGERDARIRQLEGR